MKKFRKINKITKIAEVYNSKFLNVFEIFYETKLGNQKKWIVASRKNLSKYKKMLFKEESIKIDAVLIAAIDESRDSLVLIKEFRMPINDYVYSLPAGLIDEGEDIYIAAKREMKEETGLELYDIDENSSCKKSFASVGMSDESLALVYGKARGEISTELQEESEIIESIYVDKKMAKEILSSDVNIDIKAWLVLKEFVRL
ncbi:NUDIX hydrolase [Peptostreptococcus russellii]|uniref:NUDIX hydrolase n=1 Tax=Peptostreptococcus russellii TaxID=215200 RepID=UPI003F58DFFC